MNSDSGKAENRERQIINTLEKRVYDLRNLIDIGIGLVSVLDSKNLLDSILSVCISHFFVDRAALILPDDENMHEFRMHSSRGYDRSVTSQKVFFMRESPIGSFLESSTRPLEYAELAKNFKLKNDIEKLRVFDPWLLIPLIANHSLSGLLVFGKKITHELTSAIEWEILKGFAHFAAVAVENSRMHRLAALDTVTRIYSSQYFHEVLADEIMRSKRYEKHISLLLIGIDHFGEFADKHGAKSAEQLVKGCASTLRNYLRNTDILGRHEKGSFAVLLTETDTEGALLVADRVLKKIDESSFPTDNESVHATVSIGMAHFNPEIDSCREIFLQRIEKALEESQRKGNTCTAAT
jgi:diguanylate cyclase (GGDEF)-like protein